MRFFYQKPSTQVRTKLKARAQIAAGELGPAQHGRSGAYFQIKALIGPPAQHRYRAQLPHGFGSASFGLPVRDAQLDIKIPPAPAIFKLITPNHRSEERL